MGRRVVRDLSWAGATRLAGLALAVAAMLSLTIGGPAAAETTVPAVPTTATPHTTTPAVTRPPAPTPATRITAPPSTVPAATVPPAAPAPTSPPATYYYRTTPTYYYQAPITTAAPTTTVAAPPPTTIAPIGGHIPVPPSTLPLRTRTQSTHVSPVFAALSGAGFFVAFLIMAGRFIMTRPGRKR